MPTIQDAMVRSIAGGMAEILARQTVDDATDAASDATDAASDAEDTVDDVTGTISDVKLAFSSWDNCMQATYCKWPVITVIIVVSLIIFSVVWCVIRCACCGVSCCCECCRCLKCCGNCCGCCDTPRKEKRGQYLDEPYMPPSQGYQANAPMAMGASSKSGAGGDGGAQKSAPPQYAEFDVSRKGGDEDALPEMPVWQTASKAKVLQEEEGVELDELKKTPAQNMNGSQTNLPLMAGAAGFATGPASPVSPKYPQQYSAGAGPKGYGGNGGASDPYAAPGQANSNSRGPGPYGQSQDQYAIAGAAVAGPGRQSPGQSPYGNAGGYRGQPQQAASTDPYGRTSPHAQQQRDPYAQQPTSSLDMGFQRSNSPQGGYESAYDNNAYGRQSPAMMGGLIPTGHAGPGPRKRSPGPAPQGSGYDQRSYTPANGGAGGYGNDGGYGSQQQPQQGYGGGGGYGGGYGAAQQEQPQVQRSYTGESSRPLAPQRQYTGTSTPGPQGSGLAMPGQAPARGQQSSGGGFDFSGGGYSRPTPPQRSETGESYPGKKAYQHAQQGGYR